MHTERHGNPSVMKIARKNHIGLKWVVSTSEFGWLWGMLINCRSVCAAFSLLVRTSTDGFPSRKTRWKPRQERLRFIQPCTYSNSSATAASPRKSTATKPSGDINRRVSFARASTIQSPTPSKRHSNLGSRIGKSVGCRGRR
jgi:hypothetical protein